MPQEEPVKVESEAPVTPEVTVPESPFIPDPTRFGLVHTIHLGEGTLPCFDFKCHRPIKRTERYFVDALSPNGDTYCDGCGKCLRYERKNQALREQNRAPAQR